jgi:hypothetical protein
MSRTGHITVPLSEQDRLEINIEKEGGHVKGFVVNYVATVAGHDHSVVRFDTCHGFPHKDEMDRDGRVRRKERLPAVDGHQLVDLAIDDIKANWKSYRRRFER